MYIPEFNRIEDRATALAFMRANPFAILVSNTQDGPFATHLPVAIQEANGKLLVRAHVAKANPHWRIFAEEQPAESLIIFHGAQSYISPALYENRESVPTWNYAAVHAYGRGRILANDAEKHEVLNALIASFDEPYAAQWHSLREEYRGRMLSHIVAFEIEVTRIEAKFKLSQNRTKTEQESIIQALSESSDSTIAGVAHLMRARRLGTR